MLPCKITKEMSEKIHFFHEKFPGREWSGPAWFEWEKDEFGYPTKLRLIYFHVIDIASAGETEWNQTAFMSVFPTILAQMVAAGIDPTTLLVGNIHSHHQMRAYFSGTDTAAMNEHAPAEGFWVSVIASTTKGENVKVGSNTFFKDTSRCGAISYKGKHNRSVVDYDMEVVDELHSYENDAFHDEISNATKQTSMRRLGSKVSKKKENSYSRYTPLDTLLQKDRDDIIDLAMKFHLGDQKAKDEAIWPLFKYFKFYYGVECCLEEIFDLERKEINEIKDRFGWDYGAITHDVANMKKLPKDSKGVGSVGQSNFLKKDEVINTGSSIIILPGIQNVGQDLRFD